MKHYSGASMPTEADYAAFQAIRKGSDLAVLMSLRSGETLTQAAIAEATGLNQSTVSRSLKALTDDAYLQRMDARGHRLQGSWFDVVMRLRHEVTGHEASLRRVLDSMGDGPRE